MTNKTSSITRIAIFGKGHELWPVAALLSKQLPQHIELVVIEDSRDNRPAALTLPCENRLHKQLGLETRDLIKQCDGLLGLGTELIGWRGDDSGFFTAASGSLPSVDGLPVHQVMLRAAYLYNEPDRFSYLFQPFRFAGRAASDGKFSFPLESANSPTALLGPTIQIDRAKYTALLKARAEPMVARSLSGLPTDGSTDPASGAITSVILDNGDKVEADLFVDASGMLSALPKLGNTSGARVSIDQIPFNRLASCYDGISNNIGHMQTRTRALPAGILTETPLRDGAISEFLFSTNAMKEEDVLPLIGEDAKISEFDAGYHPEPWSGNLLKIGSAAGAFGPYHSADMLMLQEQASLLAAHIPATKAMEVEAAAYNYLQAGWAEENRDFALLPMALNRRAETIWQGIKAAKLPESLSIRFDQFRSRARFVPYENALFDDQTWIDLLIELSPTPQRYDPLAEKLDMQKTASLLKKLTNDFNRTINEMPTHFDVMEEY